MVRLISSGVVVMGLFLTCGCEGSKAHVEFAAQRNRNKKLVRRYYEEVVSTGDVAALSDYISPDYAEIFEGVRYPIGLNGAREHLLGVRRTYPDLRLTVERQIAEDDWVATVVTARGTHRGVWMGMKPTHKPVEISAVNLDRVVDGRIVEHGGAANLLMPFLRIGAIQITEPVGDETQTQALEAE